MSRKNFLMGLGIGIVCCGVLLMFAAGRMQTKELSDTEIKKRAEQLGMVEAEDEPILSSERVQQESEQPTLAKDDTKDDATGNKENDSKKNTDNITGKNTGTTNDDDGGKGKDFTSDEQSDHESSDLKQDNQDQSKSTKKKQINKKKNKKKSKKQPADEDSQAETVTVTITKGMSAKQICTELQNTGVVKNAEDLEKYIQGKKSTNRLLAGTFELKKNAEFDEILGVIMH